MGVEDRQYLRLPVDLPCLRRKGEEFVVERAVNLSAGGMALATRELLAPGTVLNLQLDGPKGEEIPLQAEVAFVRSSGTKAAYLAGLRFVTGDPRIKHALDAMLLSLLELPDGKRAHRRIEARLKGRWEAGGRSFPLTTEDLSLGGALAGMPEAPEPGTAGQLVLEDVAYRKELRLAGRVVWARRAESQDHAGLKFDSTPEVRGDVQQLLRWLVLLPREAPAAPSGRSAQRLRVGPFAVGPLIGRGGMCDVFRGSGVDPPFAGKTFALKRLRPEALMVSGAVDRFETEADLGRMLSHPNLVRVHASFQFEEEYWLAMDLIQGRSLEAALGAFTPTGRPAPLEAALAVGLDLLEVLRYCHEFETAPGRCLEVVHADVTPSNLLIDQQGVLKLIDFGIAATSVLDDSESGMVATKLSYLAPELYLEGSRPDPRVDIYQTAVTLYEMIAGVRPFKAETPQEICKAVARGPVALRRLRAEVPAALEAVILGALSAEPAKRPASAAEFHRALLQAAPVPAKERRPELLRGLLKGLR